MRYFPTPYPDELLYSLIGRYHRHSGNLRFKHTIKDLFGKTTQRSVLDLPANLGYLATRIEEHHLSLDELIDNHTLLPFYQSFNSEDTINSVRSKMIKSRGGAIHNALGILASSISNEQRLRHCERCMYEDYSKFGEYYWHRKHQLPSIHICPDHHCELIVDDKLLYEYNQHQYVMPDNAFLERATTQKIDPEIIEQQIDLAGQAYWVLCNPVSIPNLNFYRDRYLVLLKYKELANVNDRVDSDLLLRAFKKVYSEKLLELNQSVVENKETNWLRMIFQKNRKSFHPVRHLLVINFLSENIQEFLKSKNKYEPFGKGPWPCLNPVHKYKEMVIDQVSISYNYTAKRTLGRFECECGYIYTRNAPILLNSDDIFKGKVLSFGAVWERQLVKKVKENRTLTSIAVEFGVDPLTVKKYAIKNNVTFGWKGEDLETAKVNERYIFAKNDKVHIEEKREDKRNQWMSIQEINPSFTTNQIRNEHPALYSWLFKYDRNWLDVHKPKSSRKGNNKLYDWSPVDLKLLREVREIIDSWKATQELVWMNKTRIASRTSKPHLIEKRPHNIPKTMAYIAEVEEPVENYKLRKIEKAYLDIIAERIKITENLIYSRAAVSKVKASWRIREFVYNLLENTLID